MKRLAGWWIAAILLVASAVWWYHGWQHWISHGTGSYNTPGSPHNYNYNSGFGSIWEPSALTLGGVAFMFYWHHQCHVTGCLRYARRTTAAGERACWRHHPDRGKVITAAHLLERHLHHLGHHGEADHGREHDVPGSTVSGAASPAS
jgi:hypothetical protein